MTPLNKGLLGALVVQGALVAVAWWPTADGPVEARDLLGFPTDQLVSVTIWGRMAPDEVPEAPVRMSRTDAGWVLDSADAYPASDTNVTPLLEQLQAMKSNESVASRVESYPALEVADDHFTRKLELTARDGTTRTLLVGAAGGREVNVRVAGEADAWRVRGVNAWSIAEHENRYFDRDFLKVDPASVSSVELVNPGQAPLQFARAEDGTWTVSGAPADLDLDPIKVADFVETALTIRMLEPVGREVKPEHGLDAGTRVSWVGADGTRSGYRVGSRVEGETGRYFLKSDHSPYVVKMLEGNVTHLTEVDPGSWRVGARAPGLLDGLPPAGGPHGRSPH